MFTKKAPVIAIVLSLLGPIRSAWAVDTDGDGVEDHLDACCNTPLGSSVDSHGRPIGDLELDCEVDLFDVAMFQSNFIGPVLPCPSGATSEDCAGDLFDFAVFHGNLSGPMLPCPSCATSDDCAIDHNCARPTGTCATPGHCEPRPPFCMPAWDPVCGCDGITHGSGCFAAQAGVRLESDSPCVPPFCETNTDCLWVGYCAKGEGDCDGLGDCTPPPIDCGSVSDPVCGCDDNTYDDRCYAALEGVSVRFEGHCPG